MAQIVGKSCEVEVYDNMFKCECGYIGVERFSKFCSECGDKILFDWSKAEDMEESYTL